MVSNGGPVCQSAAVAPWQGSWCVPLVNGLAANVSPTQRSAGAAARTAVEGAIGFALNRMKR
jgi:hypothetical protein